ncbi:MAG: hypothetical protein FWG99_00765 [Treponema sp.]|nr:hypothetical protein [Treponema sp.]
MKTKIRIGALIALAALLFTGVAVTSCMSVPGGGSDSDPAIIHYYRYDQKYDEGWNLWIWEVGGPEGSGYEFGSPDAEGWVTGTIPMESYVEEFGYIVRKSTPGNDWEDKDVADDRFSKAREIWIITGDPATYTSKPEL